jgi:hypothetical protein
MRAPTKDLSTRNVLCIGLMVICACGLHPNPAKVPNFQYRAWLYSMDQNGNDEKTRESRFWDLVQCPTAIIRQKFQNSSIRHDDILTIGNFMLMINNHFARFQLPGKLLKTKKMCSLFPWQHVISYFFSFHRCARCASVRRKNEQGGTKWKRCKRLRAVQVKILSKMLKIWNKLYRYTYHKLPLYYLLFETADYHCLSWFFLLFVNALYHNQPLFCLYCFLL